jgi:hypothetical protein
MTANQTANISPQVQQIKSMVQMLKGQANPMQVIQSMAAQNPQLSQVINMLNGSGMSAKDLFMQTAQQRGIDPNMIIDMLK